jgi:hypothetical protein
MNRRGLLTSTSVIVLNTPIAYASQLMASNRIAACAVSGSERPPRCLMSYYNPSIPGTLPLPVEGEFECPVYSGERHSLVVACEHARTIYWFLDGAPSRILKTNLPATWPRALNAFDGLTFFADHNEIVVYDYLHPTEPVRYRQRLDPLRLITSIKITSELGMVYVTVCFTGKDELNVKVYTWTKWKFTEVDIKYLEKAIEPRGAYYARGCLFVADTFGHRVYAVDTKSGEVIRNLPVYFPNTIEPAGNGVRICAEHENRVYVWQYEMPSPNNLTMEMSAPVSPYKDIQKGVEEIVRLEGGTADKNGLSKCAIEHVPGGFTLYSPNSATMTSKGLLVADTDNHRVILVRDNKIVTEVTGFNNPVNAVMLESAGSV